MSLLLDALKKAAQDKQKAKDLDKEGIQSPAKGEDEAMEAENIIEEPVDSALENPVEDKNPEDTGQEDTGQEDIGLVLEERYSEDQAAEDQISFGDEESERAESEKTEMEPADPELTIDQPFELENKGATTSTISDEALQLLIYKTNKEYRRSQKVLWTGLLSAAVILLVVGGVYFYNGMIEEVESLERKHKIAMRSVKDQPNDKYIPARPVSEPRPAQESMPVTKEAQTTKPGIKKKAIKQKPQQVNRSAKSVFVVKKTDKRDPVNDLLNEAWLAYSKEDYATAHSAYSQVLNREPLNRDAWMGEAAIAVKKGEIERARSAYSKLLKMDPRDEIATAGLANLDEKKTDSLSESKLKFMLRQQPDAAHLHFALGNFYVRQTKWPEAQSAYFNAWQGDSKNADYAFNLAVSLDHIGKQEQAERFYRMCLELSSGQNIGFSVQAVNDRLGKVAQR